MKMNLVTDPWIPVTFQNGTYESLNLKSTFERSQDIQDLNACPHERIAIMRLLICITNAALNGPKDEEEWEECLENIIPAVLRYLKDWQSSFELFGEKTAFLQISGLEVPLKENSKDEDSGKKEISKLDFSLATGNNTTLFDNKANGELRAFAPDRIIRMLLSFQCFSPGGRIGVASWNSEDTKGKGSSLHAPCTGSMVHTLIRASNLLFTIHLNLLNQKQIEQVYGLNSWGKPVWESMPTSLNDEYSIFNATRTYLGRLLPLSRAIRLLDCRFMILANGLDYEGYPSFREATATTILGKEIAKKESTIRLLTISPQKAVWRELHSILLWNRNKSLNLSGPLALSNLDGKLSIDLWTGALITDKAKIIDSVESVFHIPAEMFNDVGRLIYEEGIQYANQGLAALEEAIKVYAMKLGENASNSIAKARLMYWTAMENKVDLLIQLARNPFINTEDKNFHDSKWGKAVWERMQNTYDMVCLHSTSRQLEAYSRGKNYLIIKSNSYKLKGIV